MSLSLNSSRHRPAEAPPAAPGSFADIVRACRDGYGETQTEFAARFEGVATQAQLSKWERGFLKALPRSESLFKLSEVCRVPPGKLLESAGYWGASGPDDPQPAAPRLRELLAAARALTPRQVSALIAVAREMGRPGSS